MWKLNNLSVPAKASFAYLFVNIFQKGFAFITSPIFTRLLSPDEFGKVSVYSSLMALFGVVAMFCLNAGVFDVAMIDYTGDRMSYIKSTLVLSNIITLVTGVVLVVFYPVLKRALNISLFLLVFMFIDFIFQPAYLFWTHWQRFEYRYKIPVILSIAATIMAPSVSILAIKFIGGNKVYDRIIGSDIPLILLYAVVYIYIFANRNGNISTRFWKYAFYFNLPLIPHYLSTYILGSSDRLMVSALQGDSQAAFYSMAGNIGTVIIIVWSAINDAMVPLEMQKQGEKDYNGLRNLIQPILLVFSLLCMIVMLLAPEALKLLATKEYGIAVYVIPPIVGGVFFQALYSVFTNVLYYYKRPIFALFGSLISAFSNLVLNYIFIKKFGFIAAGYTTIVSYALQALFDYIVMDKFVGQSIYNKRFLLCLSFTLISFCLFVNVLYQNVFVRYGVITVLSVVIFVKKNVLLKVFQKSKK